jgi:hypothetical protein
MMDIWGTRDQETITIGEENIILRVFHLELLRREITIKNISSGKFPSSLRSIRIVKMTEYGKRITFQGHPSSYLVD